MDPVGLVLDAIGDVSGPLGQILAAGLGMAAAAYAVRFGWRKFRELAEDEASRGGW
jgi:hypothetical protein